MGWLARWGMILTRWTERWVPDSWVIAVMLTLFVALLALTIGGASPSAALMAWGDGLWALLSLTMQFTVMMVVAYACAVSPPLKRALIWIASRPNPDKPRQAIMLMALFSTLTAWLNWALSLVISAAFLPFIVRSNPRVDFRLLVTCAYLGVGTVWHTGLSGSAPLIIATPDNFLIKAGVLAETIPTTETMFAAFNLWYALLAGLSGILIAAVLVPPASDAVSASPDQADRLESMHEPIVKPEAMRPAEKMEWWPGWSLIASGAMLLYFVLQVREKGFGQTWTIDNYNLLFLALGLLLHASEREFSEGDVRLELGHFVGGG